MTNQILELSYKMCDIEERYVHEVYNRVASHFDQTRVAHWTEVKKYVKNLPQGSRVGDLGCWNMLICIGKVAMGVKP